MTFSSLIFIAPKQSYLIEIDGASHLEKEQQEYDQARTEYLEALGYKVIRFTNNDVRYNIHAVVTAIIEEVESRIKRHTLILAFSPKGRRDSQTEITMSKSFNLIEEKNIPELNATAKLYAHKRTGRAIAFGNQ